MHFIDADRQQGQRWRQKCCHSEKIPRSILFSAIAVSPLAYQRENLISSRRPPQTIVLKLLQRRLAELGHSRRQRRLHETHTSSSAFFTPIKVLRRQLRMHFLPGLARFRFHDFAADFLQSLFSFIAFVMEFRESRSCSQSVFNRINDPSRLSGMKLCVGELTFLQCHHFSLPPPPPL